MMLEALDIILQAWSEAGPQKFAGKYWTVYPPVDAYSGGNYGWHHRPYGPYEPRIAFAGGFGARSSLLRLAGEHGYIPMSLNFFAAHVRGHWDSVAEGASAAGRRPDRGRWRMLRDIFVADTDVEARRAVLGGFAARFWNEYFKPIAEKLNATHMFRRPGASQNAELTAEYLVDTKAWAVGSPVDRGRPHSRAIRTSWRVRHTPDARQRLRRPGRAGEMVSLDGALVDRSHAAAQRPPGTALLRRCRSAVAHPVHQRLFLAAVDLDHGAVDKEGEIGGEERY